MHLYVPRGTYREPLHRGIFDSFHLAAATGRGRPRLREAPFSEEIFARQAVFHVEQTGAALPTRALRSQHERSD